MTNLRHVSEDLSLHCAGLGLGIKPQKSVFFILIDRSDRSDRLDRLDRLDRSDRLDRLDRFVETDSRFQ